MCVCCLLQLWAQAIRAIIGDSRVVEDILKQRNRSPRSIKAHDFLRECAWAIFSARTHFRVIEKRWDSLQRAFEWWDHKAICQNESIVKGRALACLHSEQRVDAVITIARHLNQLGWSTIQDKLLKDTRSDMHGNIIPSDELLLWLKGFPRIGEASCRFIAKNLGFDLAKPDIHLVDLSQRFQYGSDSSAVQQFTSDISKLVGERIGIVETVLWNACEQKANLSFVCPCCGKQR